MNNMATLMRNVINGRGMPLTQVSERIETLYIGGRINAEERAELIELMHSKASPEAEAGDYKTMYKALAERYNKLHAEVEQLKADVAALKGTSGDLPTGGGQTAAVPAWEPYDGVSGGYAYGTVVQHGGRYWMSQLVDMTNVWEPGALGIDERYWREITEAEALAAANQ